jgi:hypothetical protein
MSIAGYSTHGGFVPLALADHDIPRDRDGFKGPPHGLDSGLIRAFAVALPHGSGGSHGGLFHHASQLESQALLDVNICLNPCQVTPPSGGVVR